MRDPQPKLGLGTEQPDSSDPRGRGGGSGPPEYDSRDLLAGGREVIIRHGADAYRLQLTGSNKLILTK